MRARQAKATLSRIAFPITLIVTLLGFVDTHLLVPIIALYASSIGASVGMVGLIVGLYSITNTPANILFGRVIDRKGHRIPLIVGLLGDALGMFCYPICKLPVHLAVVRAFHGMTGGLAGPATMAIASGHASNDHKGKIMALYGVSLATATLIGYGVSGVIASKSGYQSVFYLGSAMLLVGALLALLIPRTKNTSSVKPNISFGEEAGRIGDLFQRKGLIGSYCSIFAQYFAFGGLVTLLPLHVGNMGTEAFHVGMLLTIFTVVFILLQFPSGSLSDKVGRKMLIVAGLCLAIISLATLPMLRTFTTLTIIMGLYGASYALLFPSISALVVDQTAPQERGLAIGIFHALLTAGVAVGALIMGWMAGLVGIGIGIALSSSATVVALVVVLLVLN